VAARLPPRALAEKIVDVEPEAAGPRVLAAETGAGMLERVAVGVVLP